MLSRVIVIVVSALVALGLPGAGAASASPADNNLTGYGFDACSAPSQEVMDAWWESSPYAAVGVYIGGSNRLCDQPELTAAWVRKQRRTGWQVLPIQVGPQASCSGYADVMSPARPTAEKQGRAEAAQGRRHRPGPRDRQGQHPLLRPRGLRHPGHGRCRQAALSFLSGWTKQLARQALRSGVYSSIAAAIPSLDPRRPPVARLVRHARRHLVRVGERKADVADRRARSSTPTLGRPRRIHQYDLDVEADVRRLQLTIDANWVDVGKGSVGSASKPLCKVRGKGVSIDLKAYPSLKKGKRGPAVQAAQCLLRSNRYSKAPITGTYDARTVAGVEKAQKKLDLKVTGKLDRKTWVALLARGKQPVVKVGSTGEAVRRVQRALTAALRKPVKVDGALSKKTAKAVTKFQRKAGLPATGVVTDEVWSRLLTGG